MKVKNSTLQASLGGKGKGIQNLLRVRPEVAKDYPNLFVPNTWVVPTSYHDYFERTNGLVPVAELANESNGANLNDVVKAFWDAEFDFGLKQELVEWLQNNPGPAITRSTSTLEDELQINGRVVSLAGCYISPFYPNNPEVPLERRAEHVLQHIKMVLAYNYNPKAQRTRRAEGIDLQGRMAVLLQPAIVAELAPGVYAPTIGGVAYTQNPLPWDRSLRHEDGMARLVLGMGTRAVNPKWAFLMAPGKPSVGIGYKDNESIKQDSQENLEVMDFDYTPSMDQFLANNAVKTPHGLKVVHLNDLLSLDTSGSYVRYDNAVFNRLHGALQVFDAQNDNFRQSFNDTAIQPIVTFAGWKPQVGKMLHEVMNRVERSLIKINELYEDGGDYEITMLREGKSWRLYVVQARPLAATTTNYKPTKPPQRIPNERLLFKTISDAVDCHVDGISHIVYTPPLLLDPVAQNTKYVAQVIGTLNSIFWEKGVKYTIIGPGRWGNLDGDMGVPIEHDQITHASVMVSYPCKGITPDKCAGAHMFKHVLENGIVPISFLERELSEFEHSEYLNHDLLNTLSSQDRNQVRKYIPHIDERTANLVRVIDLSDLHPRLAAIKGDRKRGGTKLYIKKPN